MLTKNGRFGTVRVGTGRSGRFLCQMGMRVGGATPPPPTPTPPPTHTLTRPHTHTHTHTLTHTHKDTHTYTHTRTHAHTGGAAGPARAKRLAEGPPHVRASRHATCNMRNATCAMRHAACNMHLPIHSESWPEHHSFVCVRVCVCVGRGGCVA